MKKINLDLDQIFQLVPSRKQTETERLQERIASLEKRLKNTNANIDKIVAERTATLEANNSRLKQSCRSLVAAWGRAVEMRNQESEGQHLRVSDMTMQIAWHFELTDDELAYIELGAGLHDIGNTGVPDAILLKDDHLTAEERFTMQMHTVYARELLYPIEEIRPALDIPYSHHERWDGSGYPQGLKGKAIPLAARIFAVADVADALASDRPHRKAWEPDKVRAHIKALSGKHFDPAVVKAYLLVTAKPKATPKPEAKTTKPATIKKAA